MYAPRVPRTSSARTGWPLTGATALRPNPNSASPGSFRWNLSVLSAGDPRYISTVERAATNGVLAEVFPDGRLTTGVFLKDTVAVRSRRSRISASLVDCRLPGDRRRGRGCSRFPRNRAGAVGSTFAGAPGPGSAHFSAPARSRTPIARLRPSEPPAVSSTRATDRPRQKKELRPPSAPSTTTGLQDGPWWEPTFWHNSQVKRSSRTHGSPTGSSALNAGRSGTSGPLSAPRRAAVPAGQTGVHAAPAPRFRPAARRRVLSIPAAATRAAAKPCEITTGCRPGGAVRRPAKSGGSGAWAHFQPRPGTSRPVAARPPGRVQGPRPGASTRCISSPSGSTSTGAGRAGVRTSCPTGQDWRRAGIRRRLAIFTRGAG
jgi:hypothetical protein